MKNLSKIVLILLLSLVLVSPVNALRSSIYFEGGDGGFVVYPGSDWSETDLFDGLKDAMPGDEATEEINVRNAAPEYDYVKIYLHVERHDPITNPLSEEVAITETTTQMEDYLSQLNMTIYNGSEIIYESSPDQLGGLRDNVLLGTFANGEGTTLRITVSIPLSLDSEYMHRSGEIDWIFTAEGYKDGEIVPPDDEPRPLPDNTPRTVDDIRGYIVVFAICAIIFIIAALNIKKALKQDDK